MAGLARVTQALFSTTGLTPTGGFGAPAAGTVTTEAGSSNTPANIMTGTGGAWAAGWLNATLGASKFPTIEDMNAVLYTLSYQLGYVLERGIPEYDSGTTYNIGDICRQAATGNIYLSLVNTNLGNALSNGTDWQFCGNLGNLALAPFWCSTSGGSANAQTLTTGNSLSALTAGQIFYFIAGFSNTTTATVAIDSVAAKTLHKNNAAGSIVLTGGEIIANNEYEVQWNGTNLILMNPTRLAPNVYDNTIASPTARGTGSTLLMLGLAGAITPKSTGVIEIIITGQVNDTGITGAGIAIFGKYGTGAAPSNGDAASGTQFGGEGVTLNSSASTYQTPFSITGIISGITVGTAYWIDLATTTAGGTPVPLVNVHIAAKELAGL